MEEVRSSRNGSLDSHALTISNYSKMTPLQKPLQMKTLQIFGSNFSKQKRQSTHKDLSIGIKQQLWLPLTTPSLMPKTSRSQKRGQSSFCTIQQKLTHLVKISKTKRTETNAVIRNTAQIFSSMRKNMNSQANNIIKELEAKVSACKLKEEECEEEIKNLKNSLDIVTQENVKLRKLSQEIMLDHNQQVRNKNKNSREKWQVQCIPFIKMCT